MKGLLCYPGILFLLIFCMSCKGQNGRSEADNQKNTSLNNDLTEVAISEIMPSAWVAISAQENTWVLTQLCDDEPPALEFRNDTITIYTGSGVTWTYRVISDKQAIADLKKVKWELEVYQFYVDKSDKTDTLTIFVEMIDVDKSAWTIGADLNNYHFTFLNRDMMDEYPKEVIDCSDFDEEYD